VAVVAGAVILGGLALVLTLVPSGSSPKLANTIVVDNESYYFENVTILVPGWSNFTFSGVVFGFHAYCGGVTPGGAAVCGNVSPSIGVSYPFSFWIGLSNSTQTWISPSGHEGAQFIPYSGGLHRFNLVRLLVAS